MVKDLSRFGRNLIDAGNYIENIFPKLGIRFIAMTDDFDSDRKEDRDGIAVPIKNMVNAMYASDFSRKQVASFELHSRLGDKKIISVPYGYTLNKAENRLEPNPETAPIVQLIFKWYLLGVGISEIAHRLNDFRVPAPSTYKNQHSEGLWNINSINRMLQNEAYIGNRVLGKIRTATYKHIPTHATTREQWYIHSEHGTPVVFCSHSVSTGKASKCCRTRHDAKKIEGIVAYELGRQMRLLEHLGMKIEEKRRESPEYIDITGLRKRTETQLEILKAEKVRQYEGYAEGIIKKAEYIRKKDEIARKIEKLTEGLQKAEAVVAEQNSLIGEIESASEQLDAALVGKKPDKALTREMVLAMIDSVIIHDEQTIEVKFAFDDLGKRAVEYLGTVDV